MNFIVFLGFFIFRKLIGLKGYDLIGAGDLYLFEFGFDFLIVVAMYGSRTSAILYNPRKKAVQEFTLRSKEYLFWMNNRN